MALFMLYQCGYILGNFWKKMGFFLRQHLVTLVEREQADNTQLLDKGMNHSTADLLCQWFRF